MDTSSLRLTYLAPEAEVIAWEAEESVLTGSSTGESYDSPSGYSGF